MAEKKRKAGRPKIAKKKQKGGRPTKYHPSKARQAYKLCLLGYTDKQLAEFFEISESTLYKWKEDYPKFSESLKAGKILSDVNVVDSLYKRATGYSHKDVHISNYQGVITITPITKHYPPDTKAAQFILTNRHPELWADRKVVESTGKNGGPMQHEIKGVPDFIKKSLDETYEN